ncbi:SixA phosphatase family protein [Pontiella agarivorans]|uniref:Histidine phosphatase family protein n=1 Tax=Pontiella agarivorans TaxID=3038953 RepID=A0ABU5N093_9BACT|nr:histidine phosphatase family protein [Pontiella agarivorans]MDZ8119862.1 histidine phosphatase family protein [Pontiella agarivorans]
MPKTLYLVRHAKSSWVNPSYSDFDRPLNDRGRHDAPEMGRRLKEKGILPEIIISSPARRATETLDGLNRELQVNPDSVFMQKRLYEASTEILIEIIQALNNTADSALIIGHNPSMSWAIEKLSAEPGGNLPTCSVAAIRLDSNDWNLAGICTGELLFIDYPRKPA